jgi:hypothetical protein
VVKAFPWFRLASVRGMWFASFPPGADAQHMILRLSPKTATIVGENATEWEWLEQQVRAGRQTTGTRADEAGLRALAAELGWAEPVNRNETGGSRD